MDIQIEKLNLIKWISNLSDSSVINQLKEIQKDYIKTKDWASTLKNEELESINRGLDDIKNNRIHPHEEVRKIYEKYL
jgi:hypothetical protein